MGTKSELEIEKLRQERDKLLSTHNYIEYLNIEDKFSMDCFNEIMDRISTKLEYIDKSIQKYKHS